MNAMTTRVIDSRSSIPDVPVPALTEAQERFAREHAATPGGSASSNRTWIFMYREEPTGALRWLVGPDGAVLDCKLFHY
jgi:hypothetical protein